MLIAAFNIEDGLRGLCAWLCKLIYWLIGGIFELFINVSKVELLSSDNIKPIYQRVTIVLAIVMVFYVTFELVKYIVQPDQMTDKEKGADKIVTKMIIVVLLIAFVPTVFSYSYKLQNIVIEKEILPKLILGKSGVNTATYGRNFSADIFTLFYQYDKDFWNDQNGSKMCEGVSYENIVLGNIESMRTDGNFGNLTHCLNKSDKQTKNGVKSTYYMITFNGLLAVLVGGFLVYVLVLYCIDVGTRVAQLAFLQIIAPIPIIGYLSPKKENIFTKWVKQCFVTYLDLFIRLAIIYFILLVCSVITTAYNNGTLFNNVSASSSRMLIYIVLIMGLLLFAQKAPKMLQELFPKTGAASGNLGLKKGERVAPAAARAIGAGLGATRLVTGAFARGANTYRRNKQERERTGKTRKEQRADIKANRDEMKRNRKNYKKFMSERNELSKNVDEAAKKYGINSNEYKAALAAREAKQKEVQKKRDAFVESQSKYADSQNSKYRSVALNALAGAAGGAYRGTKAGIGATKLEDIGKKVKEGYANDKKAINAREQWLNTGGYSNVRRAVAGVEQSIGMTTPAGKTERDINVYNSQIKANERLIATESDVKSKEDAAKDRSGSKIEAGEQKTVIPDSEVDNLKITALDGKTKKDIEMPPVEYDTDGNALPITTSAVYAHYKEKAEKAKATATAKAQVLQNLETAKLRAGSSWSSSDEAALVKARTEADESAKNSTIADDEQGKVKKVMQEYAITDILQGKHDYQDGVLQQKVADTLTSIAETTRDEKTTAYMKNALRVQAKDSTGKPIFDSVGNPVWDEVASQKAYDDYINGNITSYKQMDDIQTALINSANERTRENVEIKGSKSRLEASSNYDAQKADDKASGGGGK